VRPFEYLRARHSAEALSLRREAPPGGGRLLAGGTDLLGLLKDDVVRPARMVDIKRMKDVDGAIRVAGDGVSIGALATLAELAEDESLAEYARMLRQAAWLAATPQLRAVATIGGNLLQRPRCWYFRHKAFHCWLEGGEDCPAHDGQNQLHAIFSAGNDNPCCAAHPSDLAPCLLALDARVVLRDAHGAERTMALEGFFQEPTAERRTETVLGDEVLVEVRLPALPAGTGTAYGKAMARQSWSFALSGVAVRLSVRDDRISEARVALGGVAGIPRRSSAAEAVLVNGEPSDILFARAADRALEDARPLSHNAYKVPLTRALIATALEAAAADV